MASGTTEGFRYDLLPESTKHLGVTEQYKGYALSDFGRRLLLASLGQQQP